MQDTIALLAREPDEADWEANMLLGILHRQARDLDNSVKFLGRSAAGNPHNPDTIFFLGCFQALQTPGSAIRSTLLKDLPQQRFISRDTRFFTLGSCFAREIATRMIERGYQADFFEVVEHITIRASRTGAWSIGRWAAAKARPASAASAPRPP